VFVVVCYWLFAIGCLLFAVVRVVVVVVAVGLLDS
jgi:hypothetical protein